MYRKKNLRNSFSLLTPPKKLQTFSMTIQLGYERLKFRIFSKLKQRFQLQWPVLSMCLKYLIAETTSSLLSQKSPQRFIVEVKMNNKG